MGPVEVLDDESATAAAAAAAVPPAVAGAGIGGGGSGSSVGGGGSHQRTPTTQQQMVHQHIQPRQQHQLQQQSHHRRQQMQLMQRQHQRQYQQQQQQQQRDQRDQRDASRRIRPKPPTGVALLRLLATGQPHWYVAQEALPTGERKTMLFIPPSGQQQERIGVTCETMSLQLLTAQSGLVDALAGMYMKSTMFRADEGLGELSLPGAPQAFLPVDRALYAAGMRDGDVVTLVDGLPANQETLAALGEKAHSKCREPCVACVRLTFLRPCGTCSSSQPLSPQSVLDMWREHVRVIVLNSVP
ncbi:unnamed protein product, partial [Scytosiphon promiscuus]